jgi:Skp family chaperone for outer membrane proteins
VRRSIACAAHVAVLCALGIAAQPAFSQTGAAAPAAAPSAGTAVAVIDIPYIFKNHTRFKAQINDIKTDIDDYKAWADAEQAKLRKEREKLDQFKPGTAEYKQVEETVARMGVETQLEAAKRQKAFMEREAMVYYNAYREVEAAVADFAARNGISLVLRYSAEPMDPTKKDTIMQGINRIVVYQSRLDITQYVLDRLNRSTPPADNANRTGPARPQIPTRPTTR